MEHWYEQGWDVEYILEKTLEWHVSTFNNKSSEIPEPWWRHVQKFRKRMGYRFVLSRVAYPDTVTPHGPLPVEMYWENKGVAPCYYDYPVVLRLTNETETVRIPTRADITSWQPGSNL